MKFVKIKNTLPFILNSLEIFELNRGQFKNSKK